MIKLDQQFGLYVIREPLAIGPSKACCRAEDPFFNRDVILKLIGSAEAGTRDNLDRLIPYLEALAGLKHPAIAPIYDCGIEDEVCYFTTTYYQGGCLADQLTSGMNLDQALRIILHLSSAFAFADNEGFEQGKFSLKDIFLSVDGDPVVSCLGIGAALARLKQAGELADPKVPSGSRLETLKGLGEILIKLLLGPAAKPDAVGIALLSQAQGKAIAKLTKDLLGLSERKITGFDELLKRIADLKIIPVEHEAGEQQDNLLTPSTSTLFNRFPELEPALPQASLMVEPDEAAPGDEKTDRLIAEKTKLQEILKRARTYKNHAERKIAAGALALETAQRAEARALKEAKEALELLAGQRPKPWHPVFWLIGGMVAGSLLSGSYGYLRLADQQRQFQAQIQTLQAKQHALQPLPSLPPLNLAQEAALPAKISAGESPTPTQQAEEEKIELWWPAGSEFDPTAAVPITPPEKAAPPLSVEAVPAMGKDQRQPPKRLANSGPAPDSPGNPELSQNSAESWWPVGNEFDPAAAQSSSPYFSAEFCPDVLCAVQNWAKAWSSKDLDSYFAFYSEDYRPETGLSKEEWRTRRLERLTRPQWIKVTIEDFQVRSFGEDRVQVKLRQKYSSDFYQDQILKSLNLVKENGRWRILTERSLGALNASGSGDMVGG
jgi:hypothetical protein